MKRIIAIDFGSKTMGIAISDENQLIAIPLLNFFFEEFNLEKPVEKFKQLIEEYEIELVLLGLPTKTSGEKATIAEFIEQFKLKIDSIIDIKYVDERFSTKRAKELLPKDKLDKFKDKKDMLAAWIILNDYLQRK